MLHEVTTATSLMQQQYRTERSLRRSGRRQGRNPTGPVLPAPHDDIAVLRVREHDFEYEGRPYRSLSAIATAIAQSRWNGWAFFGLRPNGKAR